MTPEAWHSVSAIIGTIGAVTSAVAVALITGQRGEVKRSAVAAEAARDEATAAKTNTAPMSNGFARRTTATLDELARRSRAHEQRLTWLTDALGQHLTVHGAVDIIRTKGRPPFPSRWWPPDPEEGIETGYGDPAVQDEPGDR